jgi:hypothetical protein
MYGCEAWSLTLREEGEMARAFSTNGENRNAYRILVGKPEGKNHWEDQDVGG